MKARKALPKFFEYSMLNRVIWSTNSETEGIIGFNLDKSNYFTFTFIATLYCEKCHWIKLKYQ